MLTVQGYIDGVSYGVTLGEGEQAPDGGLGCASGPVRALALLAEFDGQTVSITPVGPHVHVDITTVAGALAVLETQTQVTAVDSPDGQDIPDLAGPQLPGVAY